MEKKFYPRVTTRLPAIVTNEEGVRLKVVAIDASSEGFSFQCSTLQRNIMTPGGCYIRNGRPVELNARLELPVNNQTLPLKARCHVAFSRRIARDRCEIGMRYMNIEGDGYINLIRFIETKLASLDNVSRHYRPADAAAEPA
ncbi:MAG: PilZ domain-containing protein [Gammaproteobacteria bacterium]